MASFSTTLRRIIRRLLPVATRALNDQLNKSGRTHTEGSKQHRQPASQRSSFENESSRRTTDYPGDFRGPPRIQYAPDLNGEANPGEIVWTWVPYEEDHTQGKDRPVLIIGHDGKWLLALQLTSKDHDRDAEQEARAGRFWQDIGTGDWDRAGRPSEVRVNRIIRVDPDAVRREGAILERAMFDRVVDAVQRHAG